MPSYVLDTNIIVGYVRGSAFARRAAQAFALDASNMFLSFVTVAESESLALQLGWGALRIAEMRRHLSVQPVVPTGEAGILEAYAMIDAASKSRHPEYPLPRGASASRMGKNDLWIAATAFVLGADLVTTDGDFDHLNGCFLRVHRLDLT